jgi:hypothetical protein
MTTVSPSRIVMKRKLTRQIHNRSIKQSARVSIKKTYMTTFKEKAKKRKIKIENPTIDDGDSDSEQDCDEMQDDQVHMVSEQDRAEVQDNQDDIFVPYNNADLSRNSVFPETYCKEFNKIAKHYGAILSHQSDKDLPRTKFNSSYTSLIKNADEMGGLFVVFLIVFGSKEGGTKIDKQLETDRTSAFIHVFELLLLLENVYKQEAHL